MLLQILTITAYAFSVISFLLFVYLLLKQRSSPKPADGVGGVVTQSALSDTAKLVEALAKLSDSFSKGGPVVMTLVSAIFFFLVAMLGSGFEAAVTK